MLNRKKQKKIALLEIILLITSTIAFAYFVALEIPSVSAQGCDPADIESCPQEEIQPPSGSPNPSQVAKGVIAVESQRLLSKYLGGGSGALTAKEKENLIKWMIENGYEEEAKKLAAGEIITKKAPSFLTRFFGRVGATKWQAYRNSLLAGGVTALIAIAITFISVGLKTGDWARASEAAGRIAIGSAAGLGAYSGLVALGVIGPAGWIAGGFVMLGVWASKFLRREQQRVVSFQCSPWQAQTGGSNCELCNNKNFPCTEYQCRSLGTGCELINKDTDEPRCIHKNPRDVDPPTITPWRDVLTVGYKYNPLPRGQTGVEIKYQNEECLPAFQPFKFGVELDKEGYCKIEYERTSNFSEMRYNFGGSNIFKKNHSQTMSFPGVVHLEQAGLNITNDGEFEFYVRCQAASNGKSNREEFLFKFCIDKGPDTTSPVIRGFNWNDNSPIAYFAENEPREVGVQVYTNEPASCKWAHEDKSYENMENNLTCANNVVNFNAQLSYTCSGNLTGLENRQENKFFFRCNDTFGNVNIQSKILTLVGTQPLVIDSITPNNTVIKDSTDLVKVALEVETRAGFNEGAATCYYKKTSAGAYVKFTETESHAHATNIWLEPGAYSYSIRCIDLAGNSDTKTTSFSIETDTQAPIVVRAFKEENYLKVITNEEAKCVYSNSVQNACSYPFEDGISMTSLENNRHQTPWVSDKTFYIKCQDDFGNQPLPNECSIIIRPFGIR